MSSSIVIAAHLFPGNKLPGGSLAQDLLLHIIIELATQIKDTASFDQLAGLHLLMNASGENFSEKIAQLCYDQSWEADGGLPKYL